MYQIYYPAHCGLTTVGDLFRPVYETLEDAKNARKVSGDLVVFKGTTNIVPDEGWLWDWEREDPQTYANKAVQFAKMDSALENGG